MQKHIIPTTQHLWSTFLINMNQFLTHITEIIIYSPHPLKRGNYCNYIRHTEVLKKEKFILFQYFFAAWIKDFWCSYIFPLFFMLFRVFSRPTFLIVCVQQHSGHRRKGSLIFFDTDKKSHNFWVLCCKGGFLS